MAQQEVKLPQGASYDPPTQAGEAPLPEGVSFTAPSTTRPISKNPYDSTISPSAQLDRAKNRDYGETSMSAGGPAPAPPTDPNAVKPNTLQSFISSTGVPTNEKELTDAVQNTLAPQADPSHGFFTRMIEQTPVIGTDARARADLYERGKKEGGTLGFVHGAAAALPFVGPALTAAQDKYDQGDYAGAAGAGVNAFLTMVGAKSALGEMKNAVVPPKQGMAPANGVNLPPKPVAPGTLTEHPNAASPRQTENLNSLRPGRSTSVNMEGTDQAATSVRNAAAKLTGKEGAADLNFKGRNVQQRIKAGEQVPKAAQEALNDHETVIQRVTQPYENAAVSTQPAADAIRAQITPEMRQAALKNPKVANQIAQIEDIAAENDGTQSIKNINARRQRYNDDLAPLYDKTQQAQSEAPAVLQAKKAGVEALRNIQYDTLSDLSGTDIRPLKQKEASLIDYKADVNKRLAQAANSRSNVQPGYLERVTNALTKKNPNKDLGTIDTVKTLLGARDTTPIEEFNATAKRGLSDLAPYQAPNMPPVPHEIQTLTGYQEPLPTIRGPLFDIQQTPTPPDLSKLPAIPSDSGDLLKPGKGRAKGPKPSIYTNDQPVPASVTPSQMSAMEKAPYGGFKVDDGSVQNYGRTRRRLPTEEHPELAAQLPDVIAEAVGLKKQLPKALPPASSIQLGPSTLDVSKSSTPKASAKPAKEGTPPPVSGGKTDTTPNADERSAGLRARAARGGGSVIPERGKAFVTNEAAERRALPRSTQAQLLTSEANEIRRSIREATTPEEQQYHGQRLQMKLEELNKLGLPPELSNAIQVAPQAKAAGK